MKNIIFDYGSVLKTFNKEEVVSKFTEDEEEKEFLLNDVINSPEWAQYGLIDTGYLSHEEVINLINDRTNNKYKELVTYFMKNYYKYMYFQEELLEIIKVLKQKGYKVYLLSNTNEYMYEKNLNKIVNLFDGLVLSYKVHLLKPYESIYKYLLEKYNLIPEESLFIDDREDNMNTANRLGIKGRTVEPNNDEDVKKVLKEYNIIGD